MGLRSKLSSLAKIVSSFRSSTPAPVPAGGRRMLMVEHVVNGTRDYSLISTENNELKVVRDNLPNLSFMRTENYDYRDIADYRILDSCNALFLLLCKKVPQAPWELLWNPTTGEIQPIPPSPVQIPDPDEVVDEVNGPDEVVGHHLVYGLGFDPVSRTYKVVRSHILDYYTYLRADADVYAVQTSSWRKIPQPYDPGLGYLSGTSIHIDGTHYFLAQCYPSYVVYSFDFVTDEFLPLITIPESDKVWNLDTTDVVLAEFNGSLACIMYDFEHRGTIGWSPSFEVWVRNWRGWYRESTHALTSPGSYPLQRFLGLYDNDKALLEDANGDLLYYDCSTRHLEYLGIHDDSRLLRVFPYVQSSTP